MRVTVTVESTSAQQRRAAGWPGPGPVTVVVGGWRVARRFVGGGGGGGAGFKPHFPCRRSATRRDHKNR